MSAANVGFVGFPDICARSLRLGQVKHIRRARPRPIAESGIPNERKRMWPAARNRRSLSSEVLWCGMWVKISAVREPQASLCVDTSQERNVRIVTCRRATAGATLAERKSLERGASRLDRTLVTDIVLCKINQAAHFSRQRPPLQVNSGEWDRLTSVILKQQREATGIQS